MMNTSQPDTESDPSPNPNPNPTIKQHNSKHSTKYSHISYVYRVPVSALKRYNTITTYNVVQIRVHNSGRPKAPPVTQNASQKSSERGKNE